MNLQSTGNTSVMSVAEQCTNPHRIIDMPKIKVVCRHGVEYSLLARGSQAEANRLKEVLSNCCCYVCHNRGCEHPIEGKQDCKHECDLYGKVFCEKKEEKI